MDLQNPDLILVKRLSEHSCSYFAVESVAGTDVVLTDIESGGRFNFAKPRLEQLVSNGQLRTIARRELPTKLTFKPLSNVKKPKAETAEDVTSKKEMERRYKYVQGAIEQSVPAYTEKWLTPYITHKAAEINEYLRIHTFVRYQKVYNQFLEQLDTLNVERREADLVERKPCSYRWIVNRLQSR